MIGWLKSLFGRRAPAGDGGSLPRPGRGGPGTLRARYEAAETTRENLPLWALTDYLSAKAANSFQVRRTLKIRARYEAANNSYFRGIVDSVAEDLVGNGPRLRVHTGSAALDRAVEARWADWAAACGLAEKLQTLAKAKIQDGEAFALAVTNKDLDCPVQLDWAVIESDQVTTPDPGFIDLFWVDGVVLNRLGNPVEYHVLRHHPGDLFIPQLNPLVYDRWRPADVVHWFKKDRPGQVRGVPEITPALDLFAQLRRFTKAVLTAAETAADVAAYLKTNAPADAEAADDVAPFDTLPIDRGMLLTLPANADVGQIQAQQPATTYEMFARLLIREICRCLNVPLNVALRDSSAFNYSSGRLDHLGYHKGQRTQRGQLNACGMDKMFAAWWREARLVRGYLPAGHPEQPPGRHWYWQNLESIDPVKDATAEGLELANHTRTLAAIYAERGDDWEQALRQRAREVALAKELGLVAEAAPPAAPTPAKKPPSSAGARAAGRAGLRAGHEDQPREDNGRFAEGDAAVPAETREQWEQEDARLADRWEHEDRQLQKTRDREDAQLDREHRQLDREERQQEKQRAKEDKQVGRQRDQEEAEHEEKWEKESQAVEQRRDEEAKPFARSIENLPKEEQDEHWDRYRKERAGREAKEDTDLADRRDAERAAMERRWDHEDARTRLQREQEDEGLERRREALHEHGRQLEERRHQEDGERGERRRQEGDAVEQARDKVRQAHAQARWRGGLAHA